MKQLAPFTRYLLTHFVIILNCGNASFAGLTVDTTACNHFIHFFQRFSIGKKPCIICLYSSLVMGLGMFLFTSSIN